MKSALSQAVNWLGSFGDGRAAKDEAGAAQGAPPPAAARRRLEDEAPPAPPPVADPPGVWTPARMRFNALLWGEGFTGPGGEEEALRLAKPLGLQSSHSLLHIGAGLGGTARAVTTASGAWVSAYEQNPDLAAAGEAISKKAKLEKKAEVKPFDAAKPMFRPNYYHHALVQEALWSVADKDAMVAALVRAVKQAGQVVITDLTVGDQPLEPDDPSLLAWSRLDRSPAYLIGAKEETVLLARHGLDIRIAEEISARHVSQAVAGWRAVLEIIHEQKPSLQQATTIVQEAELWLRRLALIRKGRLKLMRWHAIRR